MCTFCIGSSCGLVGRVGCPVIEVMVIQILHPHVKVSLDKNPKLLLIGLAVPCIEAAARWYVNMRVNERPL